MPENKLLVLLLVATLFATPLTPQGEPHFKTILTKAMAEKGEIAIEVATQEIRAQYNLTQEEFEQCLADLLDLVATQKPLQDGINAMEQLIAKKTGLLTDKFVERILFLALLTAGAVSVGNTLPPPNENIVLIFGNDLSMLVSYHRLLTFWRTSLALIVLHSIMRGYRHLCSIGSTMEEHTKLVDTQISILNACWQQVIDHHRNKKPTGNAFTRRTPPSIRTP